MEVIKRSGEVVEFDPDKIYQAVLIHQDRQSV